MLPSVLARRRPRALAGLVAAALLVPPALALAQQTLAGTDGNDALSGTAGPDAIFGLAGDDALNGARGDDDLDGGPGADDLRGGPGTDAVLYGGRQGSVAVTLDGAANDGEAGERDNVRGDVEAVFGGAGGDRLTGDARANLLDGAGGDDAILGDEGIDRLLGGDGDDVITAFDGGDDLVDCGPGRDTVTADRGDLVLGCERRVPPPRVRSVVDYEVAYSGPVSRVLRMTVGRIPRGGVIEVRCGGRGCPLASTRITPKPGQTRIALANLFRGRRLRAGTTIDVRVTAARAIGRVHRFRMRHSRLPATQVLCLPPGATSPRRRC